MTYMSKNVIPVIVDDSRGFKPGPREFVKIEDTIYHLVGVDDTTNTLFLKLPGKRRERRKAAKVLAKGAK